MAIPNILVSKQRSGGNTAVFELIGGTTLCQIGNNITTSLEVPPNGDNPANNVLEFKGLRLLWHQNTIREENTGGIGNWGIVHTISDMISGEGFARHSGIHIINVSGVPTVLGGYQQIASNDVSIIRSTDGVTWTETGSTLATGSGPAGRSIVFRNKFYWRLSSSNNNITEYDPILDSSIEIDAGINTDAVNQDLCPHNNELFMIGSQGSGVTDLFFLWQKQGIVFTIIHTFAGSDLGANGKFASCCLFSDGTDLFAILPGEVGTSDANAMFRIEDPGGAGQTVTDISATVLPARFRAGGGAATERNRWHSWIDNDTNPASPDIYLWRLSQRDTGAYEAFQFINFSTALTELGSGPSFEIYFPNTKTGGSERIASKLATKVYAELEQLTPVSGSGMGSQVQFSYRVYGLGADKTATLFVDGGEEIPSSITTLTSVATGGSSSRSGNTIINVTPDSGSTLYTGIWDANADGFSPTDNVHLQLNLT